MFKSMKVAHKLPALVAGMAISASVIVGIIGYVIASAALEKEASSKLEAVLESQIKSLSYYLKSIQVDIEIMSANDEVIHGLDAFAQGWDELEGNPEAVLHKLYIEDNPNPTGKKEELDDAKDGSNYSAAHKHYHPWFRTLLRKRGYYDIFLVDMKGRLVYTVFKEEDYATNLLTGKWKDSGLGKVVKAVMDDFKPGKIVFDDFAPYAPSHGAPASFIATPIIDDQGNKKGVLVYQMPIDQINAVMRTEAGMGETGESYIVGKDLLMRSDSRFSKESTILKTKVDTVTVGKAIQGKTGVEITPDYRGVPVVSAYGPLDFNGVRWAVMAEKDEAEALKAISSMSQYMVLASLLYAVAASIIGFFAVRGMVRGISRSSEVLQQAAAGDLNVRVMNIKRRDEIGALQRATNRLLDRTEAFTREAGAALKYAARGDYFRIILPEGMVGSFARRAEIVNEGLQAMDQQTKEFRDNAVSMGETIKGVVETVSSTAVQLEASSRSMNDVANSTSDQSSKVANAAQGTAQNVQSVAAATEEFTASIAEVAQQVNRSADLGKTAVDRAKGANETITVLSDAADRIGEVVNLINDIAEQTNLLALNATIEAARAGEAGKGFAVVASEVKNLANQTARATEEIVDQIKAMQNATGAAVNAINEVGQTIDEIEESSSAIAGAVEEQQAVVTEISASVQEGVRGVNTVAETIQQVSEGANSTSSAVEQITAAAADLQKRSVGLNHDLDAFLKAVIK